MYCFHCGSLIEDDAFFCKYCGTQIKCNIHPCESPKDFYLFGKFRSLSTKKQLTILCYILWVLGWLCYYFIRRADIKYTHEYYECKFIVFSATLVVPFLIFFIYYVVKIYTSKKRVKQHCVENVESSNPSISQALLKTKDIEKIDKNSLSFINDKMVNKEIKRYSLQEFAFIYGKMQVKVIKKRGREDEKYCTFTQQGNEVRVNFDEEIGYMSAEEISARKLELCIVEYEGKYFVLSERKK